MRSFFFFQNYNKPCCTVKTVIYLEIFFDFSTMSQHENCKPEQYQEGHIRSPFSLLMQYILIFLFAAALCLGTVGFSDCAGPSLSIHSVIWNPWWWWYGSTIYWVEGKSTHVHMTIVTVKLAHLQRIPLFFFFFLFFFFLLTSQEGNDIVIKILFSYRMWGCERSVVQKRMTN